MKNEKSAIEASISGLINENIQQVLLDVLPCVAIIIRSETQEVIASNFAAKAVGAYVGAKCDEKSFWHVNVEAWGAGCEHHMEVMADGVLWDTHWIPLYNDLYLLYAIDITEFSKSEKVLKESLLGMESYRRVFQKIPESSFIVSPEGIITDVNDSAARMLGYTKPELIGHPIALVYDMESLLFLEPSVDIIRPVTSVCDEEVVLKTKDNRRKTVSLTANPVSDENGVVVHTVIFIEDVGDARHQEAEQHRNLKNELLGHVASGISYDFNNLLRAITGFVDLAAAGTDDKRVEKYLVKAQHTIEQAKLLTRDMLTLSRDGAPQKNLMQLFPYIREKVETLIREFPVKMQCDIEEGLWPGECDREQIGKVVENIVANALDAMPSGGTLSIKASNKVFTEHEHSTLPAGKYIEIAVKDSGIGIPCQMITHIFDPFYTTKPGGRGLGLTTSYTIVQRHGGCIDVYSYPGHGSIFTIYLPAAIQTDHGDAITSYLSRCYSSRKSHSREVCS